MEADRDSELLALGPQGIVVAVVPRLAVHAARREKDRLEAVLPYSSARLFDGRSDVVWCDHCRRVEARRIGLGVVVEPVVVRAGDRCGEVGLEAVRADLLAGIEAQRE